MVSLAAQAARHSRPRTMASARLRTTTGHAQGFSYGDNTTGIYYQFYIRYYIVIIIFLYEE